MTRKDFVAIAAALKDMHNALGPLSPRDQQIVYSAACTIADTLALQNARFDRVRFLEACGFPRV